MSLSVEVDSATISYDCTEDWHDAEETHYLLVTKQWRLDCLAEEHGVIAKVLVKCTIFLEIGLPVSKCSLQHLSFLQHHRHMLQGIDKFGFASH